MLLANKKFFDSLPAARESQKYEFDLSAKLVKEDTAKLTNHHQDVGRARGHQGGR